MTAAVAASPRPELAVPWVGDLAQRAACDALLADARTAVGQVTHFVHSASPPRREADHALCRQRARPGSRCMRSISTPAFILRASWRES